MKFFTCFDPPRTPGFATSGPSMTKQSFANEVDINKIMARALKSGYIPPPIIPPTYFSQAMPDSLADAYEMIARAEELFEAVPSSIRSKCTDPVAFIRFCQDPANLPALRDAGLVTSPAPSPTPPPPSEPAAEKTTPAST